MHHSDYFSRVFFNSCTAYRTRVCVFRMWMELIENENNGLNRISHHWTSFLRLKYPPSPAALKVVIPTNSRGVNDENLIHWWVCNTNNETSFSVFILLDIYITHGHDLLTAYVTVWDGAVNTIFIKIVLFYGGRESVDTMGCYFLENVQRCLIY